MAKAMEKNADDDALHEKTGLNYRAVAAQITTKSLQFKQHAFR